MSCATRALPALLLIAAWGCRGEARTPPSPVMASGPRYYVVGKNGTQTLERHPTKLLPGFGVSIVEQYRLGGELRGRSSQGREFAMRDLRPAQPSRFTGARIGNGRLDFGWVIKDGAGVRAQPDPSSKLVGRRARYARLSLVSPDGPHGFYRVASGWMSEADFVVPRVTPRPLEVAGDAPWIDVELRT